MRNVHQASRPREGAAARHMIIDGDPGGSRPFGVHQSRVADRIAARMLGTWLDRKLAAGCSPESTRLLAVRARDIVQIARRNRLAGYWERVLRVAGSGKEPTVAIPLCRDRVRAAEPAIRELARLLRAPLPVSARGVAMASVLLADGGGPLYWRDARVPLGDELRAAITWLDPALPLTADADGTAGCRDNSDLTD
jgi:hypothetical protein